MWSTANCIILFTYPFAVHFLKLIYQDSKLQLYTITNKCLYRKITKQILFSPPTSNANQFMHVPYPWHKNVRDADVMDSWRLAKCVLHTFPPYINGGMKDTLVFTRIRSSGVILRLVLVSNQKGLPFSSSFVKSQVLVAGRSTLWVDLKGLLTIFVCCGMQGSVEIFC